MVTSAEEKRAKDAARKKLQYQTNSAARERKKAASRDRYHNDSAARKKKNARDAARKKLQYHTDSATKERVKAASRDRYQTDSAVREKKKAQDRCNAQARKQILNDSRIYNFVDARSDDELNQKAQCMADELFDKMDPYINDEEGDLWYEGGACARRMTVDVKDGRVTPRGAFSNSEIVNWFSRDGTTVRKKDGSKLTTKDILALIKSGELLIFVVDTDANPQVCDAARRSWRKYAQ